MRHLILLALSFVLCAFANTALPVPEGSLDSSSATGRRAPLPGGPGSPPPGFGNPGASDGPDFADVFGVASAMSGLFDCRVHPNVYRFVHSGK